MSVCAIFLPTGKLLSVTPVTGTLSFLGRERNGFWGRFLVLALPGVIGVLKNVVVPDSTKDAFLNLKHKSSYWLAVQIVPFCDLNKLPPIYCLLTITSSTSGKVVVWTVFCPISATHIVYKSEPGAKNTKAYSLFGSR